jgi:LysM repeat protein
MTTSAILPMLTQHFVMKRLSAFFSVLCVAFSAAFAQSPLYILFNTQCTDQLEYKYTYQNLVTSAYSVRVSANERFILSAANEGITSPTLPKGAINCRDLGATPGFMDMINNHTRNVYMVHQRAQGDFLLMPLIAATNVVRNGAFYLITAPNFSFALDTTKLVNETNLATGRSQSYVYFTGMKFRSCLIEYAFRREPATAGQERSDFEFLPALGITSQRSGKNASEAEANHVRLIKVNGIALDDHIDMACDDKPSTAGTKISPYTPPVTYSTPANTPTTSYKEPNKEDASIQANAANAARPATYSTNGVVSCPEPFGQGYHIVQPGENLKAIARTYGKKDTDIIRWNNIKNPNRIEVCQKIWLQEPPKTAPSTAATKGVEAPKNAQTLTDSQRKVVNQADLLKNGTAPAQYSTTTQTQPQYYNQPQTTTQVTPAPAAAAVQPTTHKVKSGDYLYKIAKQYGCVEECIRKANNFPPEGDVMLWPGQELIIPECTCTMPANTAAKVQKTTAPQTQTQPQTVAPQTTPQQYTTQGTVTPQPQTVAPQTTPQTTPQTQPATNPIEQPKQEDTSNTYFTEHVIQVGETLNSIAYKYRVSAAELAQLNGVNPNDQLVAGRRLLIPHN